MQVGSLGDLGSSSRRIAHVAKVNSTLPDPFESPNRSIPISLRRSTLEKMFLVFLDEIRLVRMKNDHSSSGEGSKSCMYTLPFMEMTYEREHKIASRCLKKTSYVAEMASHLLFLKKQEIPNWIKKTCEHQSADHNGNDAVAEVDGLPIRPMPEGSVSSHLPTQAQTQVKISNIEVSLGMPNFISEIQAYLLNSEQAVKVGIPAREQLFSYRISPITSIPSDPIICERCEIGFIPSNYYTSSSPSSCAYHEGKLRWPPSTSENSNRGIRRNNTKRWSCCEGDRYSTACSLAQFHVYRTPASIALERTAQDVLSETNGIQDSSCSSSIKVHTYAHPTFFGTNDQKIAIMGIDCEMIYTHHGLSLARISIVGWDSKSVLLDLFVQNDHPIVDYNTTFSGITEETFKRPVKDGDSPVVSFNEAQSRVLHLLSCSYRVVLVGHSIENDLHALRIAHDLIIDTSVLFPHHLGPNYRYGLKGLAERYLRETIQADSGHSSLEDARAALDIFKFKLALDRGLISPP